MNSNVNDEIEIDLGELLHLMYRKLWIILLVGMISAISAGVYTKICIEPKYTSTTKLYIVNKSASLASLSLSDLQMGSQLTQDYMVLVKSRPVLQQVIDNLQLDLSYKQLGTMMSLDNPSNTRILTIHVEYTDPYIAKQIADEVAFVASKQISDIMEMDEPNIVEVGEVAEEASSPNLIKNVAIVGVMGVVLTMGILCITHLMNDTIRTQEEIEKYLGLTTIAMIPYVSGKAPAKEDTKRGNRKRRNVQLRREN